MKNITILIDFKDNLIGVAESPPLSAVGELCPTPEGMGLVVDKFQNVDRTIYVVKILP